MKSTYRYIPKDATVKTIPGINAVICMTILEGRKPSALAYVGKANKPRFHYSFASVERMQTYVDKFVEDTRREIESHEKMKAERKAEMNKPNSLVVGDILYNSWGWEQTNIDFYQVVESKGQTVKLRRIAGNITDGAGNSMAGYTSAVKDAFCETRNEHYETVDFLAKRVQYGNKVNMKHGYCGLWDGKPCYVSWYA